MNLFDIGLDKCSPEDVRRVRTLNVTISILVFMYAIYAFAYWILGVENAIYINIGVIVITLSLLIFNKFGLNRVSSVALGFIAVIHLLILIVFFMGVDSGLQYYILASPILSFVLIKDKDKIWIFINMVIAFSMFAFCEYVRYESPYIINIPENYFFWFHPFSTFGMTSLIFGIIYFFYQETNRAHLNIKKERDRSDDLLLNILPQDIANRLKSKPKVIADSFDSVSVLFADMVGFSSLSSDAKPEWVVEMLNTYYHAFDDLVVKYDVEKIKTIGDSYMAVSGAPKECANHTEKIILFAEEMLHAVENINNEIGYKIQLRIGISTGPITAGVIGHRKFTYDIWGDTVNVASRMESSGIPNRIQISESTFNLLNGNSNFIYRGTLQIKGKGNMKLFVNKI
ncbi:MAG: adenylate/guanylate cyclase domain-containing protein [Spirochaetia bacterium]|nr:adenylate/guanylate cyclase domain-containing protein [Spirochaetia bacterium]